MKPAIWLMRAAQAAAESGIRSPVRRFSSDCCASAKWLLTNKAMSKRNVHAPILPVFVLKSGDAFRSEVQAKRFIIKQAKRWVDNRLEKAGELSVKPNRKHI